MSVINFDCPLCGQNMEAPVKMAGMTILCPGCQALLEIPRHEEVPPASDDGEHDKKATVRIDMSLGGIPPIPAKRRVVIRRPPPEKQD